MVNLGFVLNVIEDPAERVEALLDAWQHTRRELLDTYWESVLELVHRF